MHIRRREFIVTLGGAAAWPVAARAQQLAVPVIGLLHPASRDANANRLRGFHRGLKEVGYVEGENVAIVYCFAENEPGRLEEMAADLVRRRVAMIVATTGSAPQVAKAATTTIPIVFAVNDDPVRIGLVASLARPGGNLTGINFFNAELYAKRLELLHELVPAAVRVAVLNNPNNPAAASIYRDLEGAARAIGLQIQLHQATSVREIDAAFATLARERPDAIYVAGDSLFVTRRVHLANSSIRHGFPATFSTREYSEAGGLMSYGSNLVDAYRQVGVYAGRILKGEKPADLPVVQASKFELVINAQTARLLGLTIPSGLLAIADEVIE
jgi:putative tryptophan/tyrosine transport system substrate-binding protein